MINYATIIMFFSVIVNIIWVIYKPEFSAYSNLFAALVTISIQIINNQIYAFKIRGLKNILLSITLFLCCIGLFFVVTFSINLINANSTIIDAKHDFQNGDFESAYIKLSKINKDYLIENQIIEIELLKSEATFELADYEKTNILLNDLQNICIPKKLSKCQSEVLELRARILLVQGNLQESIIILNKSIDMLDKGDEIAKARVMNFLGEGYLLIGDYDNAKKYFELSINNYELHQNQIGIANSKISLAKYYLEINDFQQSTELVKEGIAILTYSGNYPMDLMRANMLLGKIYLSENKFDQSGPIFEEIKPILKAKGLKKELADIYLSLGQVSAQKGDCDFGEKYFIESQKISALINYQNGLGYSKTSIAQCEYWKGYDHQALNNLKSANSIFAITNNKKWEANSKVSIVSILLELGDYSNMDELNNAMNIFKEIKDDYGKARVLLVEGQLLYHQNKYVESNKKLIEAKDTFDKLLPKETLVYIYGMLGQVNQKLLNSSDLSLDYYNKARDTAKDLTNLRIGLSIELDRCLFEQRNVTAIVNCIDDVKEQFESLGDQMQASYADFQIASVLIRNRDFDQSESRLKKANSVFIEKNIIRYQGQSLGLFGQIEQGRNNYELARRKFIEAQEIFEKNNYEGDSAITELNIGNLDIIKKDYITANQKFTHAKQIFLENKDYGNLVITYNSIGFSYLRQGEFEQAISVFNDVLPIAQEINKYDAIAAILTSRGSCKFALGRLDEAKEDQDNALIASANMQIQNKQLDAVIRIELAQIYISQKNYNLAKDQLDWAYNEYALSSNDKVILDRIKNIRTMIPGEKIK